METHQYDKLFEVIQDLVDKRSISIELGQSLVKEINRFARKEEVPAKYNPEDLELTPAKFNTDVSADSETMTYVDDSEDESSDY